jgi:hypothetical protein
MARESTYSGKIGEWWRLIEPLETNAADLAYLEAPRRQLEELLNQAVEINKQQAIHRAAKQDLSKQLRTIVVEGDRLTTLLRSAVKQRYGVRSEKLTEFDLQPFRGFNRKKTPAPVEAGAPKVSETVSPQDRSRI